MAIGNSYAVQSGRVRRASTTACIPISTTPLLNGYTRSFR
jgi:hypothetical protein